MKKRRGVDLPLLGVLLLEEKLGLDDPLERLAEHIQVQQNAQQENQRVVQGKLVGCYYLNLLYRDQI